MNTKFELKNLKINLLGDLKQKQVWGVLQDYLNDTNGTTHI
jgi:hypothetical protein